MTDVGILTVLIIAVIFDLTQRRIPNWLILSGLIAAFLYHGSTAGAEGLLFSLKGLGLGILLLFFPFLKGGMGAGDVKLLGVVGAFKGSIFVVNSFLWMALWGGFIVVILLIKKKRLLETLGRIGQGLLLARLGAVKISDSLDKKELSLFFPYALAIALGAVTSYFKVWWF